MAQGLLKSTEDQVLPERVRAAIREQEDATERLISWIQFFVVATFGVLYLVSPKPEVAFNLVPWALLTYFVLTVIRIVWSHRARLPPWSLAASALFDMALLMVLIWSFHLQYNQPASFYLKAPTVLYIFIFIALRALRFEARYVIISGSIAAVGWGLLILYVVFSNPQDMMLTRDYVTYMTSNSILLGAEFDKIISILMVTGIIGLALFRARALLVRSVSEQAAAQELSRFFSPEVAARIKHSDDHIRAGTGEMRHAAVLNLDMRGFTPMVGQAAPEQVMQLLAEYQSRMVPIIGRHGGSIDKFLGDGIMATFGASRPSDSYAADALRALDGVIEEAQAWRRECQAQGRSCPEVNGAVSTGRILFGAVGDDTRLEYTVIGDAVNLSAKLEKQNKDCGVRALCDQQTYDLAVAQGYRPHEGIKALPNISVSGVERPLDLVVLAP